MSVGLTGCATTLKLGFNALGVQTSEYQVHDCKIAGCLAIVVQTGITSHVMVYWRTIATDKWGAMSTIQSDTSEESHGLVKTRPQLPKQGQVVSVRGSKWAVVDIQVQSLIRSPADEGKAGLHHRVSLSSIEEDRMGEELDVIWELELGNNVQPDQGMPATIDADRFDEPRKLAAFVDAVRWGAVTSADQKKFQAPFRSSANVEAYQLEPLRRALESSRTNLLLADDVGLGKTIEAGLVVRELLLRHRARTVLIVCPPSLSIKWRDEMIEKFGLSFEIINSERIAELRRTHGLQANPFKLFPRAIVSMDWISSPRAQRLLRDLYAETFDPTSSRKTARRYAFDILVVDEAHHLAPSAANRLGHHRRCDVNRMRASHTELDKAVMHAYGWTDIELNHGFHTYRKMTRWTVCDEARVEILDRLLEENHRRAALEADSQPSSKKKSAATTNDVLF